MAGKASQLIENLQNHCYDQVLSDLYLGEANGKQQCERYVKALQQFISLFGDEEVEIYSAPGRSEICGNHTDHQYGKVLAASVDIDTIAVAAATKEAQIRIKSEGYQWTEVDLQELQANPREQGTTVSLVRGVAAGIKKRGFAIGGFKAYVTSQVLSGSGLSSSAAYEVLLGNILSGLYNDGAIDPVTIAQIGQEAENQYFGKPSGLLDQMACSVGGLVYIDFENPINPLVEKVNVDFESFGYRLCIVDTKGSHADLTDDYARIPKEMRKVAAYFGKEVLRQVDEEAFYRELPLIRKYAGDRAVLRSIHWFDENHRVEEQREALEKGDYPRFQQLIRESGNSSFRYLQNVYSIHKADDQSVAVALLMTKKFLGKEIACRVHGGGFAGTIQVFVPEEKVNEYKESIERIFGSGACHVLHVRSVGGVKVI